MSNFVDDFKTLQKISRNDYNEVYHKLGALMFEECEIPTVGDFVNTVKHNANYDKSYKKINQITSFTGNTKDIENSIMRDTNKYTDKESVDFMNKVIASNIGDISSSGYFYKKLISSCDNMRINTKKMDCGAEGELFKIDEITEDVFEYKIKTHFVQELYKYVLEYHDFIELCKNNNLTEVHVRNFLTCELDKKHKTFCCRCAGSFRRNNKDNFIPKYIGLYSTLMITEHATQASLDSMNKGVSKPINAAIEEKLQDKYPSYEAAVEKIKQIIDEIGNVGVMSKYYEIALLSRCYQQADGSVTTSTLSSSLSKQGDSLGTFIYQPTETNFNRLISLSNINAKSLKSKIMFDIYKD